MGELPLLVMRIAPVKPSPHWLVTTYSQLPLPLATELEDELLTVTLELLLATGAELLEAGAELLLLPPTMPKGEGCELQVLAEIQLRLPSHPHPSCVVAHSGYKVPYQLHC